MNIQYMSLTQCTVEFLHWVIQVINLVVTHSLNFFTITKTISDCHHFCKWKFLLSILQVVVFWELCNWHFLKQLCRCQRLLQLCRFWGSTAIMYAGGTFYTYVGGFFFFSTVTKEQSPAAIMQVEVSTTLMQVKISAAYMWVTIFIVVFSTVRYAHDYFYCNYAGGSFYYSHVCDSFK